MNHAYIDIPQQTSHNRPMSRFDDKPSQAALRRQREWEKFDQGELDDAVRAMFEHHATRRYLWWLLAISNAIGNNAFTSNALTTAFACGEQNIGQQVLAHMLEVAPDGFLTLMKENADERKRRDDELSGLRHGNGNADHDDYPADGGGEPGTYA